MAFRDIDYSLRINGDLSVPSNSIKVGGNITLNSADGSISASTINATENLQEGGVNLSTKYDKYGSWKLSANTEATPVSIASGGTVDFKSGGSITVSRSNNTITISGTDTNTWRPIHDVPTDGVVDTSISSNWAYDHENSEGIGKHVPSTVAGDETKFLRGDGLWTTVSTTDTNYYLSGISGSGNGTVTFTMSGGATNLTWDTSHTHSEYAASSHSHSEYVAKAGDTMTGSLSITIGAEALKLKAGATSDHTYMAFYADSAAQTTRSGYVGYPSIGTTVFTINNEMANGNINFLTNGTGSVQVNGNRVLTTADGMDTSNFVIKDGTSQSVGNNFSVKGRLSAGNINGIDGDIILYNGSGATIHLDGNSSGIESSTNTKAYIAGNGNATFKGTVNINTLAVTNTGVVTNLNAEKINGVSEKNLAKNISIADDTGYGIVYGLNAIAYGGELHVEPGVAFTASGMRFEIPALETRRKVAMTPASTSGTREDIVYIKGPSAGLEEGKLGYLEGTEGAAAPLTDPLLSDAVILATVTRTVNLADITSADINNDVRNQTGITGMKPLYVEKTSKNVKARYELHANKYKEGGQYLNQIYATLNGGNTFNNNQKINGRVEIVQPSGTLGGIADDPDYTLKLTGSSSQFIAFDPNEIVAKGDLNITNETGDLTLNAKAGKIVAASHIQSSNSATTLTIPSGSRQVTWTHNYGATTYAVNLTSNSFERHIRWKDKTTNSIVIEIDDPSDQDILVDCILIGY